MEFNATHQRGATAHIGRDVLNLLWSSPHQGVTYNSIVSSSQDLADMKSFATIKHPSGLCALSPTQSVLSFRFSLRSDHSNDRPRTWCLQLQPVNQPQGQILCNQVQKLRIQGVESSFFPAIQQIQYLSPYPQLLMLLDLAITSPLMTSATPENTCFRIWKGPAVVAWTSNSEAPSWTCQQR